MIFSLLEQQKLIVVTVNLPKTAKSLPDFLDPLLQRGFPSSRRIVDYTFSAVPQDSETQALIEEIVDVICAKSVSSVDGFTGDSERARRTFETAVRQLIALGYRQEVCNVKDLLKNDKISEVVRLLEIYRLYYLGPELYSLSGYHTISWRAMTNSSQTYEKGLVSGVHLFSPAGEVLAKKLKMYQPASFDEAFDSRHDYTKARQALFEFERCLAKKEKDVSFAESSALLEDIENQFDELIKSYRKKARLLEAVFLAGTIASSFVPGGFALTATLAGVSCFDPAAKILCGKEPMREAAKVFTIKKGLRSFFDISDLYRQ